MKRITTLLLALIMLLSLCGCNNAPPQPVNNTSEASPEPENNEASPDDVDDEPDEPEEIMVYLNEPTVVGVYELTITNIEYEENYLEGGDLIRRPKEGIFIWVEYTLKNISKTEQDEQISMSIDYNDGYKFTPYERYKMLGNDLVGYSSERLKPLGHAITRRVYFDVPREVGTSTNAPLNIQIVSHDEDGNKVNAVFVARPLDEKQTEAFYQQALSLMKEGTDISYYCAAERFTALGDYKDSAELLDEATKRLAVMVKDDDYISEHFDTYRVLTGDEISKMIVGGWQLSNYTYSWTFFQNGTIDDQWGTNRTWKVQGDKLILATDKSKESYEIRYVYDGGYVITRDSDNKTYTMYKVK